MTFLKDQSIYLERLTDVIAKDFTGSYYYNTGNEGDKVWRKASFTLAGGIKDYSSYKDGQVVQERKYQLVGTVSYDGTDYLTISQNGDEIYYELVQHGLVTGSTAASSPPTQTPSSARAWSKTSRRISCIISATLRPKGKART